MTTPTPQTPSAPASALSGPPTLPPPQTFDVLPALHQLLSRLLPDLTYTTDSALEPKDLAPAAAVVKLHIQKAREAVRALPEVNRTCDDQREEIAELEERVKALKAMLERLG